VKVNLQPAFDHVTPESAEPNTHLRNSRLACSNAADIAIVALFRVMLGSPTIEIC
jgi:hypothetical protein